MVGVELVKDVQQRVLATGWKWGVWGGWGGLGWGGLGVGGEGASWVGSGGRRHGRRLPTAETWRHLAVGIIWRRASMADANSCMPSMRPVVWGESLAGRARETTRRAGRAGRAGREVPAGAGLQTEFLAEQTMGVGQG